MPTPTTTPSSEATLSPDEIALAVQPTTLAGLCFRHPQPRLRLLATHGWLDNAASFSRLFPQLTQDESVSLEMPGHGRSQWLAPGAAYHFVDTVAAMVDAVEALGWERLVLVGHSLGAGVMSVVAALLPEKVTGLILIDGIGPLSAPGAEGPHNLAKALQDRKRNRDPRVYADMEKAIERLRQRDLTPDAARALAERGLKRVDGGWQFSHDPRLTWTSRLRMTEEHVRAFLSAIACPTLLLMATRGPILDHDVFPQRLACVKRAERHDFEAGHHLHLEQPELVLPAIEDFLSRLPT